MTPTRREIEGRIDDLVEGTETSGVHSDREPWGLFPEGPERHEAMAAALEVKRAVGFVSESELPDGRREEQHARLGLFHQRFPEAVDRRDDAVVETAPPLLAGNDLHVDVADLFLPFVASIPQWWSEADASRYSRSVERGATEMAHTLLVGLAYESMADHGTDGNGSGREVPA